MPWTPIYDSQTNSDFAGSVSPVGAGQVLVNGWTDVNGGVWSIGSSYLSSHASVLDETAFLTNFLVRPPAEDTTDQRMVLQLAANSNIAAQGLIIDLRWNRLTNANLSAY